VSKPGITYLLWHDLVGVTRTRGVPTRDLAQRMSAGLGWARAGQALTAFGNIVDNPWGPIDEVRQIPDVLTAFTIPGDHETPDFNAIICDSRVDERTAWTCCGRNFLRSALEALKTETGLTICASFEHEFSVSGDAFEPAAPFSLAAAERQNRLLTDLEVALSAAGVTPFTIEPEYGLGQYEATFSPDVGMRAADACLVARETIRAIARRRALSASFTPKASSDAVGNGAHIHLSLVDEAGRNQTYDPDGPMNLSPVAARFSAGVLEHIDALLAITAPTPVSYFRLGPHHWSAGYRAIGLQNREAALRVTPGIGGENSKRQGHNIEYRPCDGAASPYLVLGALVLAGLDGVHRELECPAGLTKDPADLSEEERRVAKITPLPASLEEALSALQKDATARRWFPPDMLDVYLALKRWEIGMAASLGVEQTFHRYRSAY
jgi:glutamine synthetase